MSALQGMSVLLTGGASGLGRAILTRFLEEGANVTVLDRAADKLKEAEADYAPALQVVPGDVRSPADNSVAVASAVATFGGLDVFIGNAGLWDFGKELTDFDPDGLSRAFDELFAVNVKGYLLGARAARCALRATGGCMIFTLSNASFFPAGGGALYTASKHAGVGLVRQLAYELAPKIRVNGVAVGGMPGDLRGPGAPEMADRSLADIPVQRYLQDHTALGVAVEPEDYVGPYVFLASRGDSRTVTGSVFDVSSVGIPQRS
ncbi:3-(cis-5,6-dihydroxycyclohexa-1,3-dien-1-yl)propanoate dehydrogenase [Amycolatopsis sp. GM8]|uniref:3-(cis-5,6-dihydroxycyclohexa-1, 3-dien-1-yl)propanoate dehydrogenase n=1 Tax=Amycolatopsis sp. GM8 TaxID=2896530 RepID=UPI001F017F16|nr:3-(cis-5,6-dihydroxycyclohexa-1,3-dien-1-yl)propanoate dehydrogenase [Amycolatopsis sp. GM8]